MNKYTTKPIDFTGCHPVIAEHLKRGEQILCRVYDNNWNSGSEGFVYNYIAGGNYPYIVVGNYYKRAEPLIRHEKAKRIMTADRAIPILFAMGYKFDDSGCLAPPDSETDSRLYPENFKFFGEPLEGAPPWFMGHLEILEEVEPQSRGEQQ